MQIAAKQTLQFDSAFLGDGWADNAVISVDGNGIIDSIEKNVTSIDVGVKHIPGIAIPGMVNVHSHAFQRNFAGLSEFQTGQHDSFWTWRKLMYDFVEKLTPEDMYKTAKALYLELRNAGYTWVGEFHYVHNAPDGQPYEDRSCLADAVIRAAQDTGIGICIMPVLYQRGGFKDEELTPTQRRFYLDDDSFMDLVTGLESKWGDESDVKIGIAFHSLRAVAMDGIRRVADSWRATNPNGVIHIHVAEQMQEVEDCIAETGRRSVEYLMAEVDVDSRWCLIHATHLNEREVRSIADSGAVVGLCPATEANLGDGIFPAPEFMRAGGHIAIGSDSHISVSPRSELRLLEYGQRLTRHCRAILGTDTESVGTHLYTRCAAGGAAAIDIPTGSLSVGKRADIVVLDPSHPTIANADVTRVFDRYVFCDTGNPVTRTLIRGGQ